VTGLAGRIAPLWEKFQIPQALEEIWTQVRKTNTFLEETRPWTASKEGRKDDVAASLRNGAEAMRIFALLLYPVIPTTAGKMWDQLGLGAAALADARLESAARWGYIGPNAPLGTATPLFPRIDATAE
jgi:methionyl-tRNA synthetase